LRPTPPLFDFNHSERAHINCKDDLATPEWRENTVQLNERILFILQLSILLFKAKVLEAGILISLVIYILTFKASQWKLNLNKIYISYI